MRFTNTTSNEDSRLGEAEDAASAIQDVVLIVERLDGVIDKYKEKLVLANWRLRNAGLEEVE